jgi:hypothetical protein
MARERNPFSPQMLVLLVIAITATSSTWIRRGSDERPAAQQGVSREKETAAPTVKSLKKEPLAPLPILRPLVQLAAAVGSEPLFFLRAPGEPDLSPSFRTAATERCAEGQLANTFTDTTPPSPESPPDACGVVAAVRARAGNHQTHILIATLPDWVDSSLQWMFDPMLDAIQMSAAQMGYVLTGFDLADTEPDPLTIQPKGSVWPYPRVHETTPGSLLFRKANVDEKSKEPEFLLILLVGETATAGIHSAAFAAALDLALLWQPPEGGIEPLDGPFARHINSVQILGPTFSGSTFSMELGLEQAAGRHKLDTSEAASFDVVTGSASSSPNNHMVFEKRNIATFRAATRSDTEVLSALSRYLGRSNRGWQCGDHVALLVEANTTWGRNVAESIRAGSCEACLKRDPSKQFFPCAAVVPFPLHISRLRGARPLTVGETAKLPAAAAISLDLGEKLPPVDRVPPETPQLTAATVEIMVGGMFRAMEDRQITAIGVLATDKRDHIYLAEEIAHRRPNVLPFTIESNLVYLHPDVSGYVRGTVVASAYSLTDHSQRLTSPALGQHLPQQFGSSPAHGAFNALAVLMHHPEQLLDYNMPLGLGERAANEAARGSCEYGTQGVDNLCLPPVWINVVGRAGLFPLDADQKGTCRGLADRSGYALCRNLVSGVPSNGNGKDDKSRAAEKGVCKDNHVPYFTASRLFLVEASMLWLAMVGYQVWVQRRIDARPSPAKPAGQLNVRELAYAVWAWIRSLWRPFEIRDSADRELTASVVGLRGASVAIFLWLMKIMSIYWADQCDWPSAQVQHIYSWIAGAALLYVVWQVIDAFWRVDFTEWRGWAGGLLVVLLVVASIAWSVIAENRPQLVSRQLEFNIAECAVALFAISLQPKGTDKPASRQNVRWRRLPVLLGLGAFVSLVLDLSIEHWGAVAALVYADRTASLDGLVSPASTIFLLSGAVFWWGMWNIRRLELLQLPEGQVGIGRYLEHRARSAGLSPQDYFCEPTLTLGSFIAIPTVATVIALWYGREYVGSIDGRYFSTFLLLGAAAVAAIMLHSLAHSIYLASAVVRLLIALDRHPAKPKFKVLGGESFSWRITFRETSRSDLELLVRHMKKLDSALDGLAQRGRDRARPWVEDLGRQCRLAIKNVSPARPDSSNRFEVSDESGISDNVPLEQNDWRALDQLCRSSARFLKATLWRSRLPATPVSAEVGVVLDEMEYIVLFHASLVIRDLLTRLVSGFTMVIGGLLLLVAAHLLYTFQGRVFWLSFDAVVVTVSSAIAVKYLMVLERDPVLSALWHTAPGKITLFGGLTWRMLSYLAVILITLFAVAFPELGGQMLKWVAPARDVLGN